MGRNCTIIGSDGTTTGATGAGPGEAPDDDEELRDDELAPPPHEELSRADRFC